MKQLNQWLAWLIPARRVTHPDPSHPIARTLCRSHQLRRRQVKNFWIVAGGIMIAMPVLPVVAAVLLFTTFLSFMYLDESDLVMEEQRWG